MHSVMIKNYVNGCFRESLNVRKDMKDSEKQRLRSEVEEKI